MSAAQASMIATAAAVGASVGYVLSKGSLSKSMENLSVKEAEVAEKSRPKGLTAGSPAKEGERTYLIGGNWKCNGSLASAKELIKAFNEAGPIPANVEVVIAAPSIHLGLCLSELRDDIAIAAQNCGVNSLQGAFTGEICASQLKDIGCTWVIIGHSERREGFGMPGESDELVAKKVKVVLDAGLKVMFAIGEKKEERQAGITMEICAKQLAPAAKLLTENDWTNVAIAYEPVWAIGTGLTATPEMAQETHAAIRKWISDNVSPSVASNIRIQYGGSMKGSNANDLLAQTDIDGGLIGGASLTTDFFNCINGCPQ